MCVMEIRPGQQLVTMAQAMAHNTRTIEGDIELLAPVVKVRRTAKSYSRKLEAARKHLHLAYLQFMDIFGDELALMDKLDPEGATGSEALRRPLKSFDEEIAIEGARIAARHAHPYESR